MNLAAQLLGSGRKRLAIVGTGITGLLAAERLCRAHDVVASASTSRTAVA